MHMGLQIATQLEHNLKLSEFGILLYLGFIYDLVRSEVDHRTKNGVCLLIRLLGEVTFLKVEGGG